MKKYSILIIWMLIAAFFVMGCAGYDMNLATPLLMAKGGTTIAVASVDQREYVLSKKSEPPYIATVRGTFGNPWSEYTASEKPVADEVTNILCAALNKNGFKTQPVYVAPSHNTLEAENALKEKNGNRSILVQITELRGDIWMGDRCYLDLKVQILDKEARLLVQNSVKYEGGAGMSFSKSGAVRNIMGKVREQLEKLLNTTELIEALR